MGKLIYEFHYRPGNSWSNESYHRYQGEIKDVASKCFEEVPHYQIMSATPQELSSYILIMVRNSEEKLIAFCSAIILDIPGISNVLHLGLTCVLPDYRSRGLTHKLISKLNIYFYLRHCYFQPYWITNVACVLSSLANVANNFDEVFPSPSFTEKRKEHFLIAEKINKDYRELMAINKEAHFETSHFTFKGSVKGTVFSKEAQDARYHHRRKEFNQFYQDLINFENGDEVLQVGRVSFLTIVKYLQRPFKQIFKLIPNLSYE